MNKTVKDLLRQTAHFVLDSVVQLFLMLFGLGFVIATFVDKSFLPERVMVYQGLGLALAGTGLTRLLDLWWGMDSSKKTLDELRVQRNEIQALRAEVVRVINLLEQGGKQEMPGHLPMNEIIPQNGQPPEIEADLIVS